MGGYSESESDWVSELGSESKVRPKKYKNVVIKDVGGCLQRRNKKPRFSAANWENKWKMLQKR